MNACDVSRLKSVTLTRAPPSGEPQRGREREPGVNRITFDLLSSSNEGGRLKEAVETKLDLVLEGDDDLEPAMTIALRGED